MFLWLVPLPEGRYRRQAPYADVSETLGLRGGPKRPNMISRGRKLIRLSVGPSVSNA